MAAEPNPDSITASVDAYRPSGYAETTWPQIEAAPVENTFRPAQFEVVAQPVFATDPMFANFELESVVVVPESDSATPYEPEPLQTESVEFSEDTLAQQAWDFVDDPQQLGELSASTDENNEAINPPVVEELEPSEGPQDHVVEQEAHEAALAAAREEGYASGVAATRQELDAACTEMREQCAVLVEDFKTQSQEMLADYERKAVELAMQIARRMVGSVVESQREYIIAIIQEAMQSLASATLKEIRVSPRDFDFLVNQGAGEQVKTGEESDRVFTSDETIKSGCVIVTSSGEVNFDLDEAWNRLHTKVAKGPQS